MTTLLPTLDDTVGPYFPPCFAANGYLDMLNSHAGIVSRAKGSPIRLDVRLLDIDGKTATGSLLEVWQPNAEGHLRVPGNEQQLNSDPFFQGYGRVYSAEGVYTIDTVMPGSMQAGPVSRAPFVTLSIFTDGISRIVTQVFFEGSALNEADPVLLGLPEQLRGRLVAKRNGERNGVPVYAIDVQMRGPQETPFFDDNVPSPEKHQ